MLLENNLQLFVIIWKNVEEFKIENSFTFLWKILRGFKKSY